uniref:Amino acid permease/ SLC12A domain-containing protein n=1 Tax=Romanomermis culicivorax TaxID=13658 RepID=A0A915HPL3_ROMCU
MINDSNHKDSGVDAPIFRPGYVNRAYENYSPKFSNANNHILVTPTPSVNPVKFGWIIGVLMRCFLSIIGGMLFLRVSWVGAHAGSGFGALIIVISSFVATLTALSMCAICTNGEVKA